MPATQTQAHSTVEKSLNEINWSQLTKNRRYHPSPQNWEDEFLYFLFVDRFSDGKEKGGFKDVDGKAVKATGRNTPLFSFSNDAWSADFDDWFSAGKKWCGGTIKGLEDKLGYLKRLGVTAIWLSPIFKQVTGSNDYHGYGIQNFLDVDPHYGSREELKNFVAKAHEAGIRVILDIILNHAGDVFTYEGNHPYNYYKGKSFPVGGFRKASGDSGSIPFNEMDLSNFNDDMMKTAVWPVEFQKKENWTRKGQIRHWDAFPEYIEGDFCSLKDLVHGSSLTDPSQSWDIVKQVKSFRKAPTMDYLCEVYKFWIAYADIDGYRIDTVKHMEPGAVRYFTNVVHEYAQSLGKENFYLIGEITGGRQHAFNLMERTGLDAALGINDIPDKLENLAKGWRNPGNPKTDALEGYFDLFRNSILDSKNSHQWYGKHVVTMFDDHDQVGVKHKYRFCGDNGQSFHQLPLALGLNLTTIGIPCIYYGTEQAFSGKDPRGGDDSYSDAFLRECMFGGPFGSLQSVNRHFFNEDHSTYRFLSKLAKLRSENIALRRGRQYLREIADVSNSSSFFYPEMIQNELRYVVAWSRIFAGKEMLCAMNTSIDKKHTVYITLDSEIQKVGDQIKCTLSNISSLEGTECKIKAINGTTAKITLPPLSFAIFE